MEELLDSDWPRIPFNKVWCMQKYLITVKTKKDRIQLVTRALKAIGSDQEFAEAVKQFNTEDYKELISKLSEQRCKDPKTFFRIIKALAGLKKQSTLVKGFIEKNDAEGTLNTDVPLAVGLTKRITDLYCPEKTSLSYVIVNALADSQKDAPIELSTQEVISATKSISWFKSAGEDGMEDILFHAISGDNRLMGKLT